METLADLTPENVRKSTTDDAAERAGRARPVTPQEQEDWDARVAEVEERRSGRTTIAPLVVAGIAVAGVVGLIVWFTASSGGPVVVDTMPTPVIAADRAGEAVYPADSAEAVRENVRFGFAPAVELVELGDGTVVLGTGGPDDGKDIFGAPYGELTAQQFAEAAIPAPREDTPAGTPVTWADAFADYGEDTIFLPAVDTAGELDSVLEAAAGEGTGRDDRRDAIIVRTADADLLESTVNAGAVALYDGDLTDVEPAALEAAGYWGVALPADTTDLAPWTDAGLSVWIAGQVSPAQVQELVGAGAAGVIVPDPFAAQGDEDG